jgi:hypothetical protein
VTQRLNPCASPLERSAKSVQSESSQQTQPDSERLARLDRARNRAASEHNGGEESELNAVRVAVLDAQAAEDVEQTDRDAGGDRGDRASANVARDAAASGQGTEEEGDIGERLCGAVSSESN